MFYSSQPAKDWAKLRTDVHLNFSARDMRLERFRWWRRPRAVHSWCVLGHDRIRNKSSSRLRDTGFPTWPEYIAKGALGGLHLCDLDDLVWWSMERYYPSALAR